MAIKIIDIDETNDEAENGIKGLISELNFMKICSNYNKNNYSVKFYEYYKYKKEFAIIMELCDNNLKAIWNERKVPFKPEEIYQIMSQLNNTFKIMVNNGIVHRDIKLENILVKFDDKEKKNFIVKLTDYGISKQITTTTICHTHAGTSLTMAPEVLRGTEEYDNKCDLWSIGVIIYQLAFKENPFNGLTEVALLFDIESKKPLKKSEDIYLNDLISRLLVIDRRERLTWEEYFDHPFFNKDSSIQKTKNYSNQIIINLKISKTDRGKKIYFLANDTYILNGIPMNYNEEFNELNKENTELYINDVKKEFNKYFEPSLNEGEEFAIKLIIKNKIKNCSNMFRNCQKITKIDLSSFDSSEVDNMSCMFFKCIYLEEINLSNLDTKNVIDMHRMFQKCKSLKNIAFPQSFITKNVKDISLMFSDCNNLESINLPFNTENIENMRGLFQNCHNLKKIDLSSFKTDQVENMASMFEKCTSLEEIIFDSEKFKTISVDCMSRMFKDCQALAKLNVNSFNTEKVKYMNNMFKGCKKILELNLSNFSSKNVDDITHMFELCSNLKKVNISSFKDNSNFKFNNMFDECPKLETVKVYNENMKSKFQKEFETINFIL